MHFEYEHDSCIPVLEFELLTEKTVPEKIFLNRAKLNVGTFLYVLSSSMEEKMNLSLAPYELLQSRLRVLDSEGGLVIAFSGGLDSRFLAYAALKAGVRPQLYHVSGPHVPSSESMACLRWSAAHGLSLHTLSCNPLLVPEVRKNDRERCYFCKKELFSRLREATEGVICDGTNASDLGQYRPGLRALRELGIYSPLAECGIDKPAIRRLAREQGMDQPDQPSRPCLLTRLDYGLSPTRELLGRLERIEALMAEILTGEAADFRVRIRKDTETERLSESSNLAHAMPLGQRDELPAGLHCLVQLSHAVDEDKREALSRIVEQEGLGTPEWLLGASVSGFFDHPE